MKYILALVFIFLSYWLVKIQPMIKCADNKGVYHDNKCFKRVSSDKG